ncbi:tRNA pseudouridine synthase B [Bienertia sinuspersici]
MLVSCMPFKCKRILLFGRRRFGKAELAIEKVVADVYYRIAFVMPKRTSQWGCWTSFTVCGKLRRLTKVKKVGHAGTLDPMATGLLIVCVGKATKLVDSYQGMIKGYSGVFRLGEATSTWDADSPVCLMFLAAMGSFGYIIGYKEKREKGEARSRKGQGRSGELKIHVGRLPTIAVASTVVKDVSPTCFILDCRSIDSSTHILGFFDIKLWNVVNLFRNDRRAEFGLVIQREPWEHVKDEDIRKAAASFTGEIWQVPPMFSAIKVSLCYISFDFGSLSHQILIFSSLFFPGV